MDRKRASRWNPAARHGAGAYQMDCQERGWPCSPGYYSTDGDYWYWMDRDGGETLCPADGPDFAPAGGLRIELVGGPRALRRGIGPQPGGEPFSEERSWSCAR